jgi:hypothetical protein
MANEERKPLDDFSVRKTDNGGWVVWQSMDRVYEYAFASDRDMLAALPGLIGYNGNENFLPSQVVGTPYDRSLGPRSGEMSRQRLDDAVEATKAEMGDGRGRYGTVWPSGEKFFAVGDGPLTRIDE